MSSWVLDSNEFSGNITLPNLPTRVIVGIAFLELDQTTP